MNRYVVATLGGLLLAAPLLGVGRIGGGARPAPRPATPPARGPAFSGGPGPTPRPTTPVVAPSRPSHVPSGRPAPPVQPMNRPAPPVQPMNRPAPPVQPMNRPTGRPDFNPAKPIGSKPSIPVGRPDFKPSTKPAPPTAGVLPSRPGGGGGGIAPRPDRPNVLPNRPGGGGGGIAPRPDRPNVLPNRPGGGGGGIAPRPDRPIINQPIGTIHRPTINKPVINKPTTVVNKPTNITNVTHGGTTINNTVNTTSVFRGGNVHTAVAGYHRPWHGYHHGWYYGNWGGRWDRIPSFWLGYSYGRTDAYLATGGLLALGAASLPVFYNPYYVVPVSPPPVIVVGAPSVTISPPVSVYQVFDYSQPVSVVTAEQEKEADDDVTKYAMGRFDDAREAFKRGLHSTALTRIEQAIKLLPSDTTMHEFRALILFAQNKYKDSAAGLYSVLATGPGMDWNTMSRLYPDQETFEKQLRALEAYVKENPKNGEGHFLLAYHYLVLEQRDAAADEFAAAVQANPKDALSASLYQALTAPPQAEPES